MLSGEEQFAVNREITQLEDNGYAYFNENKYPDAITIFEQIFNICKGKNIDPDKEIYLKLGIAYEKTEQPLMSKKNFAKYVYNTINTNLGHPNTHLFSYRTINQHLLQDLILSEVTVSNPATFNDPFDTPLYLYLSSTGNIDKNDDSLPEGLVAMLKKICVRSFVGDHTNFCNDFDQLADHINNQSSIQKPQIRREFYNNILMWSHYADSHRGICIEYSMSDLNSIEDKSIITQFVKVNYEPHNVALKGSRFLDYRHGFIDKHKDWKYESEIRLIYFNPNNEELHIGLPLSNDSKIAAIYFGLRCSDKDKKLIKTILKDQDIQFYQMRHNPQNMYQPIAEIDTSGM